MVRSVGEWLAHLGLAKYTDLFANNEIDLKVLPHLSEADLRELGLPMGPRKKLLAAIAELAGHEPGLIGVGTPSREAERRQLTVMFCDMVGSTRLSTFLDPEETRDIILAYQRTVAAEIARFDGYIARYMGDGVLAYFGYPQAHEDDAERAVRAGLAIVAAVDCLSGPTGESLAARIGISTGPVVVGDMIGEGAAEEEAVTGETPNLAARLHGVAGPGQVILSKGTLNLIGALFSVQDLGPQTLKGYDGPINVWRVVAERALSSRFEAAHGAGVTPLVGRKQEIAFLLDRWGRAKEGDGQAVLLTGEAGIGKSRLLSALSQELMADGFTPLRYQCSPHRTNSMLHPFIDQIVRDAKIEERDSADTKFDKLEAFLGYDGDTLNDAASLLAALLSIPVGQRYRRLELGAPLQMQRTQEVLLARLTGMATQRAVLILFEDIHWADPTTLDVLGFLLNRIQNIHVFAIITFRPEFRPPWATAAMATILSLNRLNRRESTAIISDLSDGKSLPLSVMNQIIDKADGVPLFVEELTKSVLESNALEEQEDRFVLAGPLQQLTIPNTLHDSLIARLDKLGPVKELAQTGAAIGREFSHRMISDVSSLSESRLAEGLERLLDAELIFRSAAPPDAVYVFKHALVRDVAYETLLREKRVALHARIFDSLNQNFPQLIEAEPEILAHHATRARNIEGAVECWLRAGQRAAANSANVEAVSHLRNGLQLLADLPENDARDRTELSYLISLGPALMATIGWAAEEVDRVYSRSRILARKTNQPEVLFPAVWGLWLVAHSGGSASRAGELLVELQELAKAGGSDDLVLQAHHASGSEMYTKANFDKAHYHIDASFALYRSDRHADHALRYGGHDPCVCTQSIGALVHLMKGDIKMAEKYSQSAMSLATRVSHRPSIAHADLYRAELCHLLRRPIEAEERAIRVVDIAEQFGLAHYAAWGQMLIGWSQCLLGTTDHGIATLEHGLANLRQVGIRYHLPHRLALWAEALIALGDTEPANHAAEECLAAVMDTGERWYEPEALRLVALARFSRKSKVSEDVLDLLGRSLEAAGIVGARYWQLRAGSTLARVLRQSGRVNEAYDVLAPICQQFDTDFDIPDLKDANSLLKELRADYLWCADESK